MDQEGGHSLVTIGLLGAVGLIGISAFTFRVNIGECAIVLNPTGGTIDDKIYSEGTYSTFPLVRKVVKYNVRPQPHTMNAIVYTRDAVKVRIDVRVLTRPLIHRLPAIHRNYGENYFDLVLRSSIHGALGDVTAEYDADQLIRERKEIRTGIHEQLTARFSRYDIEVDDVFITNMAIGPDEIKETEAMELIAKVEANRQAMERRLNFLSSTVDWHGQKLNSLSLVEYTQMRRHLTLCLVDYAE